MSGGYLAAGMSLAEVTEEGIMRIAASDGGVPFSQEHVAAFHDVAPQANNALEYAAAPQTDAPAVTQTADLDLQVDQPAAKPLTPELA